MRRRWNKRRERGGEHVKKDEMVKDGSMIKRLGDQGQLWDWLVRFFSPLFQGRAMA